MRLCLSVGRCFSEYTGEYISVFELLMASDERSGDHRTECTSLLTVETILETQKREKDIKGDLEWMHAVFILVLWCYDRCYSDMVFDLKTIIILIMACCLFPYRSGTLT